MMQNPQLSASLFRALTTACKEEESLSSWPEWVFLAKYRAKRRIFSPKNWKKQNWSILEDIGKYHFFQATGLLVLGFRGKIMEITWQQLVFQGLGMSELSPDHQHSFDDNWKNYVCFLHFFAERLKSAESLSAIQFFKVKIMTFKLFSLGFFGPTNGGQKSSRSQFFLAHAILHGTCVFLLPSETSMENGGQPQGQITWRCSWVFSPNSMGVKRGKIYHLDLKRCWNFPQAKTKGISKC